MDSSQFTKAQLDQIVKAFYDVADIIDSDNFEAETGIGDHTAKENFVAARNAVYKVTA